MEPYCKVLAIQLVPIQKMNQRGGQGQLSRFFIQLIFLGVDSFLKVLLVLLFKGLGLIRSHLCSPRLHLFDLDQDQDQDPSIHPSIFSFLVHQVNNNNNPGHMILQK